ncbi:hypothetical protein, partial [Salmonella sp. s58760]|uniref:hypothetical protein n=1 Tax=Salmonella sp. s58760 TaxID=3159708 RepID=UPI0039816160
ERPEITASKMLPLFLVSVMSLSGCWTSVCFGVREDPGVRMSEELEVLLPPAFSLGRFERVAPGAGPCFLFAVFMLGSRLSSDSKRSSGSS